MRVRKRISKRINTRQRNRIQKKVSEHHRKARKLAKKSTQWKAKKPRNLGIPNSFPFKEKVLAEQEDARRKREEERERKRKGDSNGVESGAEAHGLDEEIEVGNDFKVGVQIDDNEEEESIEGEFDSEDEEEDEDDEEDMDDEEDEGEESRSSDSEWEGIESDAEGETSDVDSLTELNTVRNSAKPPYLTAINRADLVIFVLDARAVNLTRSPQLEAYTEKKGKALMYVLNRAECVPPDELQQAIDRFSQFVPTLPIFIMSPERFDHNVTPSESVKMIRSVIDEIEGNIAIIGSPFVGKSTLFTALLNLPAPRRSTDSLRSRALSPKTTLVDTPSFPPDLTPLHALLGLTYPSFESIEALIAILDRLPEEYWTQVEKLYGIPALMRPIEGNRFVHPARDLCVHVARKFGRLGKGGPNLEAAAQIIVEDCLKGKIRWWIVD